MRRLPILLLSAALLAPLCAVPASGAVSAKFERWAKGPVSYLFTEADKKAWNEVTDDQQAMTFVRLFWARRDPTPNTPENEFRKQFQERVAYANAHFKQEKKAGWDTDRGKVLILLGPPSKTSRENSQGFASSGGSETGTGGSAGGSINHPTQNYEHSYTEVWWYDQDQLPKGFKVNRLYVRFRTEEGYGQNVMNRDAQVLSALDTAVQGAVTRPNLTAADLEPAQAGKASGAESGEEAASGKIEAWDAKPNSDPARIAAAQKMAEAGAAGATLKADLVTEPFRSADQRWILPIQVSTTQSVGDKPVTLFGNLKDSQGTEVVSFERSQPWHSEAGQSLLQETVSVPPGEYDLTVGVANPQNQVVWGSEKKVTVPNPGESFWLSNLILTDDLYPMKKKQEMLQPFAWQGIKVVPRGDATFAQGDTMWFYVHACNAALGTDGKPNLAETAEIVGPAKFRGPMHLAPAKATDDCWVLAQGFDLSPKGFPVGDYTLTLQVTDLTAKKSATSKAEFHVVAKK
ncbi:MAG TPA: GWxTD domain-containing protein [Thermoanaerobaculia bacterium]|nr:GWxTD domain-containing protein [Thermoanaerobaculia bacterium]